MLQAMYNCIFHKWLYEHGRYFCFFYIYFFIYFNFVGEPVFKAQMF